MLFLNSFNTTIFLGYNSNSRSLVKLEETLSFYSSVFGLDDHKVQKATVKQRMVG
jgi:hypothetical protein